MTTRSPDNPTLPRRYRHLFPTPRTPVWSARTITLLSLFTLALTAALVYALGHRSLLVETDRLLAVTSLALFTFLTVGLYKGARVRHDLDPTDFRAVSFDRLGDLTPDLASAPDCPLDLVGDDLGGGLLGLLFSLLLSVVLLLAFVTVGWLLINLGLGLTFLLLLALGYAFSRALRQVFSHRHTTRGRLAPSLAYAVLYTLLYTGWLFVLAHTANHFLNR